MTLSVPDAFAKFKSRLEITQSEQDDAARRHNTIREQVATELPVANHFLTGSYIRHTKTKPLKDVDIFLVLAASEDEYLDKPPQEILNKVRGILVSHYGDTWVSFGRRSVRVDFGVKVLDDVSADIVSFDVTPSFTFDQGYKIPDAVTGNWIGTDPKVHADRATAANQAFSGQWKPLVKMIKKWNDHHDKPIKPSFLLEVMALSLLDPPWSESYPYEIRQFFASGQDRLDEVWADPAGLGPPVSDRLATDPVVREAAREALRAAEASCTEAILLERQQRTGDALTAWQALFGPLFSKS